MRTYPPPSSSPRLPSLLSILVFSWMLYAPCLIAQQSVTSSPISVNLMSPYTATGIYVSKGDSITIKAYGEMNFYTGGCDNLCVTTPAGATCYETDFYDNDLPCWSLFAQIYAGEPFKVGNYVEDRIADVSGELYLGVNDEVSAYGDNTGYWGAVITIIPAALAPSNPAQPQSVALLSHEQAVQGRALLRPSLPSRYPAQPPSGRGLASAK